jgi:hypothetical protein
MFFDSVGSRLRLLHGWRMGYTLLKGRRQRPVEHLVKDISIRIHDWSQAHLPTPPRLGKEKWLLRTYLHSCIVASRNAITLKSISHWIYHKSQQMRHIQYTTANILVSWQDQKSLIQGKTSIQRVPVQILFAALVCPLPPWEDLAVAAIVSGCVGGRVADK